jgi:nitroreductase
MNATMETMMQHRSVRKFTDQELPEGLLEELIACGQQASTSSNLQAYSIIHLSDPERKSALAELCANQTQIHESAVFLAFCADLNRCKMAGELQGAERFDGDFAEALLIATVDVALVMQNVAVAAESEGLGICMIGAMRNHPVSVGELLSLPPYVYAVAGMCIGYPNQQPDVKPRLPLGAVLQKDRYLDVETHKNHLETYDRTSSDFYEAQGMHQEDSRWTSVAGGRAGQFHRREELDQFLTEQGFRVRSNNR